MSRDELFAELERISDLAIQSQDTKDVGGVLLTICGAMCMYEDRALFDHVIVFSERQLELCREMRAANARENGGPR